MTLTPENVEFFEKMSFAETITYLEKLDDDYYSAILSAVEQARLYENPDGSRYYSYRDLYLHYQRKHISDHKLNIYDINDEQHCFSRRF